VNPSPFAQTPYSKDKPVAINDVVQCRIIFAWHSQTCIVTTNYLLRGVTMTPSDVGEQVSSTIGIPWSQCASADCSIVRFESQRISPKPRTFVVVRSVSIPGTIAGTSVPTSCAAVIRKHTANAGKAFRGRFFWPGISRVHEQNSVVNGVGIPLWNNLALACKSQISIAGGEVADPVLIAPRPDGNLSLPLVLTDCVFDNIIRNQRRRQVGRGI